MEKFFIAKSILEQNKEEEAKRLRELLFQVEKLQHDRIYYFLVSETIFFLAASTIKDNEKVIAVFTGAGIVVAVFFTLVNLKTFFRILWIIRRLEKVDTLYKEYMSFHQFDRLVQLGNFSRIAIWFCRIQPPRCSDIQQYPQPSPIGYLRSGIFLTFWLFIVILVTWIFFFLYTSHCSFSI
ncbi:MAG: hypothetical protein AB7G75_32920 [Candidatus Binatia bacterium]